MPRMEQSIVAFNRGLVSRLALARVDLARLAFSCETMTNWMPRTMGSMMLRPGFGYIGSTAGNNTARYIAFIFAIDDTALLEFTANIMRVWVNDALVTRVAVSTAISNGLFNTDLTGWTDNDEAGGTSVWVTGGYMGLTGNGTAAAIRDQTVTVAGADQNDEHALRIIIERGPVTLRVGTSTSDDSYIRETSLATGTHSLTFTPTGDFNIRFQSRIKRQVLVTSIAVESSGVMELPTSYGNTELPKLRYDQSGDVVFIACQNDTPRKIERRSTTSWSIVLYTPNDGPFRTLNVGPITITPSALSGNVTLTASAPLFRDTHAPNSSQAGALFRLASDGQRVQADVTGADQWTSAIRITGVDASRVFTIKREGTWSATVTLQRSLESATGAWEDITTYTTNEVITFDDGLDNQIAWYRIGVKTANYTSGTVELELFYALGSITGIVRITAFTSSTVVSAEVIVDLGDTTATDDWWEGTWSRLRGWPSSVAFYEGRLGWAAKDKIALSVSDAYESFDDDVEGDSGPILRSIGTGPVDNINWLLGLNRLIIGGGGAEHSCRSTAFDEPLTPTNFNIKSISSQGSGAVGALKVDTNGFFVQRGGTRLFEITYNPEIYDYASIDLCLLVPELCDPRIVRMAVQRQPDTRIHCVLNDGTAAVLVYDKAEKVLCWVLITTNDTGIEDVVVLPGIEGENEDHVYYLCRRTFGGSTVRYLEKWAKESECIGEDVNKIADSHIVYAGAATTTITGLDHLEGHNVVVWGDGRDLGTYTVTGGQVTGLSESVTDAVVGLTYVGRWQSAKLGKTLTKYKHIDHVGLVLANTHAQGLKVGHSLVEADMDYIPLVRNGSPVSENQVYTDYDEEGQEFPGTWDQDARLCLRAAAPRPVTVLAAVISGEVY